MSQNFEEWKEDWEENKDGYEPGQSELFERVRDRKNLEKRVEEAV